MHILLANRSKDSQSGGIYLGHSLGRASPGHKHLVFYAALISLVLIALFASFVLFPTPIEATDDPNSVEFVDHFVVKNIYHDGDYMLLLHYKLAYTVIPTTPIDETFIFRLMDTDAVTELGSTTAYPFADNGYGHGVVALYFTPAEAPVWDGLYIMRISGNPSAFATPPIYNHTLVASDYTNAETQEDNQEALATWLLDVAMQLEIEWDASLLDLTDTGVVFSTTGESYFRYAIPGLQVMCPDLFYVQTKNPVYTQTERSTNQTDTYAARYNNVLWLKRAQQGAADLAGGSTTLVGGLFVLGICVFFIILSAKYFQTTLPGFMAGIALYSCGALMGWVSGAMLGVIGLAFVLYIGYFLLFNRA